MDDSTADASGSERGRWARYAAMTQDYPPRPLLVRAVALLAGPGDALDMGPGAGNDSRYLLARGFRVTAVDADAAAVQRLVALGDERLRVVHSTFAEFAFAPDGYDLINAQLALPFNPPATFPSTFARLRSALRPGACFTGHLFGVRDGWNRPGTTLTFHTREEAEALLTGLQVVEFHERDEEVQLASGAPHRAHAFEIIARQPAG